MRVDLAADESLRRLLKRAAIKIVDVGARGRVPSELLRLGRFADVVAFEPEAEEATRLADQYSNGRVRWRSVTVVPAAVGARDGEAVLYVTTKPSMTSLRRPDRAAALRFGRGKPLDVKEAVSVPTLTLDSAAERYGFTDAAFIKIDAPGGELEVLASGRRLIADSLVGVYVESLLQPMYDECPLFADVDTFLRSERFELVELRRSLWRVRGRRQETYSRRHVVAAHCLYFRAPDSLAGRTPLALHLARYLVFLLVHDYFDDALDLVEDERHAATLAEFGRGDVAGAVERYVARASVERLAGVTHPERVLAFGDSDARGT